jgi:hypothetical protein
LHAGGAGSKNRVMRETTAQLSVDKMLAMLVINSTWPLTSSFR